MRNTPRGPQLRITQDAAADELLGRDPLALLLGMLFDHHMGQRSSRTARAAGQGCRMGRQARAVHNSRSVSTFVSVALVPALRRAQSTSSQLTYWRTPLLNGSEPLRTRS